MNENDKSRSGLQTAVDFAHAARAAKRIMQAAAVSGVHGAAAATAREAFPLLLKILIAALVVFIVVPMVIFTALPNIFFGYNSSGTDTVIKSIYPALLIPVQRTIWILRPTPYRHGRTTGATYGALMEMFLRLPSLSTKNSSIRTV